MRGPRLSVIAAALLSAAPALAWVTEPNDLRVPLDSNNGETQLDDLFAQRGEQIDWREHALEVPETFSPLCDFVVSLVLRGSSSRLPFGWYNVPPSGANAPTAAEINELIPCDAAVGAAITSQSIKSNPKYAGGLVGFALGSGGGCLRFDAPQGIEQIHFSEKRFNAKYQNDPNRPWVMSLKYNSTREPNAFYLAFEDYRATPDGWQNDGDFNDYVVFMTGLACPGGGVACDTGRPGACGPGVLQCNVGKLVCTGIVSGSDKEQCDAVDNDCNGIIDDGDLCSDDKVCHGGKCVPRCGSGEFSCAPGTVCDSASGLCLDPGCAGKTCPEGEICVAGACKAPCGDIKCPAPQVCLLGACVDPCLGKTCPDRQVCDEGMCRPTCTCTPCSAGTECNELSGLCVEPGCGGNKTCAPGTFCAAAECVDSCSGAICPSRQRCASGACVPQDDAGSSGAGGSAGIGIGGMSGITGSGGADAGPGPGAGGANNATNKAKPSDAGCGCITASAPRRSLWVLALLGLLPLIRRRRTNSDVRAKAARVVPSGAPSRARILAVCDRDRMQCREKAARSRVRAACGRTAR